MAESSDSVNPMNFAAPKMEQKMNDCGQAKILVTEDDTFYRKSVSRFIGDNGYTSLEAANGQDALDIVQKERPVLILTDLRMPVMDGFELLNELSIEAPDTPVIVFSGLGRNADIINAFRCGAIDYIEKPVIDTHLLLERIEKALTRHPGWTGHDTCLWSKTFKMTGQEISDGKALTRQDEWERVADSLHEPIALFDTSHRLLQANKAMAAVLDESRSDLIGSVRYLSTEGFGNRKRARQDLNLLRHHEAVSGRFFAPDQGSFFEVKITPYYGPDPHALAGCVYIARDITNF